MLNIKTLIHNNTIINYFKSRKKQVLITSFVIILSVVLPLIFFNLFFLNKIFPGVKVVNISVSGLTKNEALDKIKSSVKAADNIQLVYQNQKFQIPLSFINFTYNYDETVQTTYDLYRKGTTFNNLVNRLSSLFNNQDIGLQFDLSEAKLRENLSVISAQVSLEPVYPSAEVVDKQVRINYGKAGQEVDSNKLLSAINKNLSYADFSPIHIPTYVVDPTLKESEAEGYRLRAEKLLSKSIEFIVYEQTLKIEEDEIINLLNPKGGYLQEKLNTLIQKLAKDIEREPQNPTFVFENNKVKEFAPAKDGIYVEKDQLASLIISELTSLENSDSDLISIKVPTIKIPPDYNTEDVNDLGIKELLGVGNSKFAGSISSRIHNISVSSAKFNGILIPPETILSFNDSLGDVSEYTGYKQAYIIRDGKTMLGDGGGVCQVSTTLFRAALNAGLPIIERRAHSYRVGYYEQDSLPGIDATVYAPTTDLKFKNDTPGHILVQTIFDAKNARLTFEIYGTSDGRVANITKPVVTDVVPPPEDLYTDDPTLPAGEIKQIDWKAWGAKVWFNYTVERNEEIIFQKTFYSNFRPWQAKFLRGTGPAV